MDTTAHGAFGVRAPRRGRRRLVLLALTVALVLVGTAAAARPDLLRSPGGLRTPWSGVAAGACQDTVVALVVAPDILGVVQDVLAPVAGRRLADGRCLRVEVRSQAPGDTVRDAATLPVDRAPQLWIPDSSLWVPRLPRWQVVRSTGFASSPVVLATSRAAVDRLGWADRAPTWPQALGGPRPVALTGLADNAAGITSLLAMWQSLGRGAEAERAVAAAVLAAARTRTPSAQAAVEAAARNAPDAPLLLTSELTVFATNRGQARPQLVAVYPRDGAPPLDYPVVQVEPRRSTPAAALAVRAVLDQLGSAAAREATRRRGLRDPAGAAGASGSGPTGGGVSPKAVSVRSLPAPAVLGGFVDRLARLAVPSRLLVAMDVSLSMRQGVPGTPLDRITLASLAAGAAGDLLPDSASVGLWRFAVDLDGARAWQQLVPLRVLGTRTGPGTRSQRDLVNALLRGLPRRLSPGGTGLYATTLAAVRELRRDYDPDALNTVVLFTDGRNEDASSIDLRTLVRQLRADARANASRRVQVVAIGIGPEADLDALGQIAQATSGSSYRADTPDELRTVLFDALARRTR